MKTLKAGLSNWRTTLAGVLTSVGFLLAALAKAIDGDPDTVVDAAAVLQALSAIGMIIWAYITKDAD